jgi:hypothetical protein
MQLNPMQLLDRKSRPQRLLETVTKSLPDVDPGKAKKAGLIAGGSLAGLTAGSVGLASLRRHREEAEDES